MTLNTVTLKWDLTDLIQAGLSATLSITPTAQMSDTTDHVLISVVARTFTFTGGTGQLAGIVANDDPNILPAYNPPSEPGAGYLISVTSAAGQVIVPQFQTQILFANGATQWLDALVTVPVVATAYQYLPLPSGTAAAGRVPAATGVGEASAWTALTAADVGADPSGAAATAQANAEAASVSLSGFTALGDTLYGSGAGAVATLAGNTSATRKFWRQQGTGTASAAPAWDQVQAADVVSLPWVTVSAAGIANGGSAIANNGADFGPDTPGTTTSGIQEAFNSLPSCTVYDAYNNQFSGQTGCVILLGGVFSTTTEIVIGPGVYRFTGAGTSQWSEVFNITGPYQNLGGSVIAGSDYTHPVLNVPLATSGYPATVLWMDGIEVRIASPASVQTSAAPSVLFVPGWEFGEISNVAALEVGAAGGIANHMMIIADFGGGAPTNGNDVVLRNIRGYGGNTGVRINRTHCRAVNISGGSTGNSINATATGISITQQLGNVFEGLHTFSTRYGLTIQPYNPATGQPRVPLVIKNVHFEAVTHYINTAAANSTGTLFLDEPTWDETSPVPATDIAAQLAAQSSAPNAATLAGLAVVTSRELNNKNIASGWHVAPAPASLTAGASPYTFPAWPYDVLLVLSSTGGMTALTLDGQALFGGAFAVGQIVPVRAGHTLTATWATTAPVFEVIPQ